MALITGSVAQGEARTYGAAVQCDGCTTRAAKREAGTVEGAVRLAQQEATDEGFAAHARGRKWLCPACRLRALPAHLQRLFPGLLAQYGLQLPPEEEAAPPTRPKRARARKE
jgi:hypothetical protein